MSAAEVGSTAVADELVGLHFATQHLEPAGLDPFAVDELEPFLRGLLFSDGMVTRALSVRLLDHVVVDVVDQCETGLPADAARYLDADAGTTSLRRRVTMSVGGRPLGICAESHLLPGRLPQAFTTALDGAPQGVGRSMEQLSLESRRELLWFRLGAPSRWCEGDTAEGTVLERLYRIVTTGRPALLIGETFAVEQCAGRYRLARLGV